jgi:hypothetical protein
MAVLAFAVLHSAAAVLPRTNRPCRKLNLLGRAHAGRHRCRLRRHRHQPAVCLKEVFGSRPRAAHAGQRLRRALAGVLDADRHRLAQVRGAGAARRQQRRGRLDRHVGAGLAGGQRPAGAARACCWLAFSARHLFYGDGVITPAISVLSAVEGWRSPPVALHRFVIPITLVVLTALFLGCSASAPAAWASFSVPSRCCGLWCWRWLGRTSSATRSWLKALSPHHALFFMSQNPGIAFIIWARWCCASPGPRRCMPTWATSAKADPRGLVWPGDACAHAQLLWPGRDAADQPEAVKQPLLRNGARLGA